MSKRIARTLTLWIIFLAILISAYWSGMDYVAMRRESIKVAAPVVVNFDLTPQYEEALNVSLSRGYCQAVNWKWAEA